MSKVMANINLNGDNDNHLPPMSVSKVSIFSLTIPTQHHTGRTT